MYPEFFLPLNLFESNPISQIRSEQVKYYIILNGTFMKKNPVTKTLKKNNGLEISLVFDGMRLLNFQISILVIWF